MVAKLLVCRPFLSHTLAKLVFSNVAQATYGKNYVLEITLFPFRLSNFVARRLSTVTFWSFVIFYAAQAVYKNYIIPIPPPMPDISGIAGAFSSGMSTTAASVVSNIEATLAAFSKADLVTFAGSTIPALNISP